MSGRAVRILGWGLGIALAYGIFSFFETRGRMVLGLVVMAGVAAYNFFMWNRVRLGREKRANTSMSKTAREWDVLPLVCVLILAAFLRAVWSDLPGPLRLISVSLIVLALAIWRLYKCRPQRGAGGGI